VATRIYSTSSDASYELHEEKELRELVNGRLRFVRVKADKPTWISAETVARIESDAELSTYRGADFN